MNSALIVVDVQNDFLPGGNLPVPKGNEILPTVNDLIDEFSLVILTQDWHPADHSSFASYQRFPKVEPFTVVNRFYGPQVLWPDHCIQGTHGARFSSELNTTSASLILRKGMSVPVDSYSAFLDAARNQTGLAGYLTHRAVREVYVCGLAFDYCVSATAVDAANMGFDTYVVENACRAIDNEGSLDKARWAMRNAGVHVYWSGKDIESEVDF